MNVAERFWSKVDRGPSCWHWAASKVSGRGYGKFTPKHGRWVLAHRWAWQEVNGAIPHGMCVCHRCDEPSCVNPSHLFLGTHAENMADMRAKGRARPWPGSRFKPRLSAEELDLIAADVRPQSEVAREFGVHQGTVSRIRNGKYPRQASCER